MRQECPAEAVPGPSDHPTAPPAESIAPARLPTIPAARPSDDPSAPGLDRPGGSVPPTIPTAPSCS